MSPTGAPSPLKPAVPLRHRPSVTEMTQPELEAFRAAITELLSKEDDRGYQYHAGIHGLPLPMYCNQAHGTPAFLPWHRAYLYRFELALRDTEAAKKADHDVMLPWWDWVNDRGIPPAYADSDAANPLHSVPINRVALSQGAKGAGATDIGDPDARRREEARERRLAQTPNTTRKTADPSYLPTEEQIRLLLDEYTDFVSFWMTLENYHGEVHVWVGGDMEDIPFAAYDPIFWAHHCMIDRLWRMWQLKHPQASFPTNVASEVMEPFNLTAAEVLDPTTLGYDYATASTAVIVKG
jgi:tyrosinase